MKALKLKKTTQQDFITYAAVIVAFLVVTLLLNTGVIGRKFASLLVPVCCYICMAVSLNLTVGILGELSLGHAGFMSIGAYSGIITAMALKESISSGAVRLLLAILVGAIMAAIFGFLIGIPVLRLNGDYLAIVTLAFGEIIKNIVTCLIVGVDENGVHILFNLDGTKSIADLGLSETGHAIIKGAQGSVGTDTIATFFFGFLLVMITLIIVLNYVRSASGRQVMAIRDNRIAAESVGLNITKAKMIAFVISAALAGAAGALYGNNYSTLVAAKFDYNTSILVLVFVVLGGLGNIRGSIIAATLLYILPEALRGFSNYRMFIYAILLIAMMLITNNAKIKAFTANLLSSIKKNRKEDAANE